MDEIGTASPSLMGIRNYPGVPEGDDVPDARDMPPLVHHLTRGLGQFAPPSVALPMIRAGTAYRNYNFMLGNMGQVNPQMMRGYRDAMNLNRERWLMNAEQANRNLEETLREYREAYIMYGPSTGKNGKIKPGDPAELERIIGEIATKHHHQPVLNALHTHGFEPVENLLRRLDADGQDLSKALHLEREKIELERSQLKLKEDRSKAEERSHARDAFKGTRPSGVSMPKPAAIAPADIPTQPSPAGTDFDINNLPPEPSKEAAPADTTTPTETTTPEGPAAAPTAAAPDRRSEAEPEAEETPQEPQKPIQMAEADTGIASDIGPAPFTMGWGGRPTAPAAAAPAPAATAPATVVPAAVPAARPTAPPAAAPEPEPAPYQPRHSGTLDAFHALDLWDDDKLNTLALKYANKTLTQAEARQFDPEIRRLISSRAAEYEEEYNRIINSNLKGLAVIGAIKTFDPQYAGSLSAYVGGRARPPQSAWQNAAWQARTMALGEKVDPQFNTATFGERISMYNAYAHGLQGRSINAIATLDLHAGDMIDHLTRLKQLDPGMFTRYTAGWSLTDIRGLRASPEVVAIVNQLGVDQQVVRDEFAKAIGTPGQIHVGAQHEAEGQLDFKFRTADAVIASLQDMKHLAHRKMQTLIQQYDAVMGPTRGDLGGLFDQFAVGPDSKGPDAIPVTGDAIQHAKDMINEGRWRGAIKIERVQ
jgi:hypothetical protein